jgi:hypothetical protein
MRWVILILMISIALSLRAQTYKDSLELYINSKAVNDFYKNNRQYFVIERDNGSKSPQGANREARSRFKGVESDYYQKIDSRRYRQRETNHTILNMEAPFQIFHKDIEPTSFVLYKNDDSESPYRHDIVGLYLYINKPVRIKRSRVLKDREVVDVNREPSCERLFREGELIQDWVGVPNLQIVSDRTTGKLFPFAIQNRKGDRISFQDYKHGKVPVGFQYPSL